MRRAPLISLASALTLAAMAPAHAQQQPDAGRVLQEVQPRMTLPLPSAHIGIASPASTTVRPGGPAMLLQHVKITGNTVVPTKILSGLLADALGHSYTLAQLQGLADRLTAYYHQHDYPFAKALIPAQSVNGGTLYIVVVEGRYGHVAVTGTDPRATAAQPFLSNLRRGELITGAPLERATLILNDQPGYAFTPVIQPGNAAGTGDLDVQMVRGPRVGGEVSLDDAGNRYTGRYRALSSLHADSPFMLGDQLTVNGIYTNENMWFGSAGYASPLGSSGLRGNVGYAHTYYELGGSFSALDAHGTADIASMGVSYPLLRSQQRNLSLGATYQHKWLKDEQDSTGTNNGKSSDSLPVALNFDNRDGLLGGGVSYGSLAWTHGILDLDATLAAADNTSAGSNGDFDKFNLDVARLQALPVDNLVLFVRASGQLAGNNLDSSEDFGLGGPSGVRAYPTGEGFGDSGWLAQSELRYNFSVASPYVFYDYGQVMTNENPWVTGDNQRTLGGAGFGLRASYRGWQADASAAWRTNGGAPQSDTQNNLPQLWMSLGYKF